MSLSQEQVPLTTKEDLSEFLTRRFIDVANELVKPSKFPERKEMPPKPQVGDMHYFGDPADHSYDAIITVEGFWGFTSAGWVGLGLTGGGTGLSAWEKISEATPAAATTFDIIWDETLYSAVKIILENIQPATDNAHMDMQFGHTNGGTIITSGYDGTVNIYSNTTLSGISTTLPRLATSIGNDASDKGVYGEIDVLSFGSNSQGAMANCYLIHEDGSTTPHAQRTYIFLGGEDSVIDTFQLILTTGNFAVVGSVKLYGLKI